MAAQDTLARIFALPLAESCRHFRSLVKRNKPADVRLGRLSKEIYVLMQETYGKVWMRRRRIFRVLRDYGINDQRSAEWHSKRSEMITASEVTKAYSTPAARYEMVMKKLVGKLPGEDDRPGALIWGTRMEPLAKKMYEQIHGLTIVDTSCVKHPKYDFLGASPDGILMPANTMDPRWGTLIEFKCPISRKFDDKSPIPDSYYHQMQMQMECTGIDRCEYVEVQFKMIPSTDWEKDGSRFKGVFVTFDDGYTLYKEDDVHVNTWKKTQVVPLVEEHGEYRMHYWTIPLYREVSVLRDPEWLTKHIDALTDVWQEVLRHRAAGTLPENPTKSTAHVLSI